MLLLLPAWAALETAPHIIKHNLVQEVKFIANFVEKLCGKNIQIMMQLNAC